MDVTTVSARCAALWSSMARSGGLGHVIASMYGRMTLPTRHASAAWSSSSIDRPRRPRYERRASRATSSPIFSRYLKQSATVFALDVIFTSTPSMTCVSTPWALAFPENRTIRTGGQEATGLLAFTSMATHTSCGACVPIPWNESADSRQTTPAGIRLAASASVWCAVTRSAARR